MQQIKQMVQTEADAAANRVYQKLGTQFAVPQVPVHEHNGSDSPPIPPTSLTMMDFIPSTPGGVANLAWLGLQVIDNPNDNGKNSSQIPILTIPVIYGSGTTTSITFTGTPSAGATSATLTAPWGGQSPLTVYFGSGEVRLVAFSGTAATWGPALNVGAISSTATIIANARFKGGEAPYGTTIFFRNDDDNIYQLWFRSKTNTVLATWWGFDVGSTNFIY